MKKNAITLDHLLCPFKFMNCIILKRLHLGRNGLQNLSKNASDHTGSLHKHAIQLEVSWQWKLNCQSPTKNWWHLLGQIIR